MGHTVYYNIRVTPQEELFDAQGHSRLRLAGEVKTKLGQPGQAISPNAYIGVGSRQGYENGQPWYREAIDSADTQYLSDEQSASTVYIRNTGREYASSGVLGDALNKALEILIGSTRITVLDPGEPWMLKDDNAGINPLNIFVRTINLDGSESSSIGHLAVEFFIAHVYDEDSFALEHQLYLQFGA